MKNFNMYAAPFVIAGLGKSGLSAKKFLQLKGIKEDQIFTLDEKQDAHFNSWSQLTDLSVGTIVLSPGIPLKNSALENLKSKGWIITSEINLACSILADEIIIGITGSVGKSTVTSLIGAALQNEDHYAFVGGNLGIPFCEYACSILNGQHKAKYVVLELSSYQLENAQQLKLDYSLITFLSANHLERYSSKDEYYKTKCEIGKMTKHYCIINASSEDLISYKKNISGLVEETNYIKSENKSAIDAASLIGDHNKDNIAMAYKVGLLLNIKTDSLNKILTFKGLNHRLEIVGKFNDILFINDSKATAMDSVRVAVDAAVTQLKQQGRLHLLLGGKDKNLPWEELSVLNKPFIAPVFFGQCGELAKNKSRLSGPVYTQLKTACDNIFKIAEPNDVVLLSPGGTSLDEFKNFEDRGQFFKNFVNEFYSSK